MGEERTVWSRRFDCFRPSSVQCVLKYYDGIHIIFIVYAYILLIICGMVFFPSLVRAGAQQLFEVNDGHQASFTGKKQGRDERMQEDYRTSAAYFADVR